MCWPQSKAVLPQCLNTEMVIKSSADQRGHNVPVYVCVAENGDFGECVHWLPTQLTFAVILPDGSLGCCSVKGLTSPGRSPLTSG